MRETPKVDIAGKRFGLWTVLAFDPATRHPYWKWICRCDCGKIKSVWQNQLRYGMSQSCGHAINVKHALSGTPIYKTWDGMKSRCLWPNHQDFANYGGRGIRICVGLRRSPTVIVQLIGNKPSGKSIDRVNNEGHYSCGACYQCRRNNWPMNLRWATPKQQANNRRKRRQ